MLLIQQMTLAQRGMVLPAIFTFISLWLDRLWSYCFCDDCCNQLVVLRLSRYFEQTIRVEDGCSNSQEAGELV